MSLSAAELDRLLNASGALRSGHFRLSSGLHSPNYVQCALLLQEPARARKIGEALADLLTGLSVDSIVAPAMGGLLIGHEVAAALGVPFRFVEREGGDFALRRGFVLSPDERVVLVEDVVTTGKSTLEARRVVEAAGARVVGFCSILDRTAGDALPGLRALLRLTIPTYEEGSCPLCAAGKPVVKPGSRPVPD